MHGFSKKYYILWKITVVKYAGIRYNVVIKMDKYREDNPVENRSEELKQYLVPGKHVHLVGIGGVSMRPLGLVLKGMGMLVTGSDMNASVSTD